MINWDRLEFFPGWAETRVRRRLEREARIEWASRDPIFFAASVANASECLVWTIFFLVGTLGGLLGAFMLPADLGLGLPIEYRHFPRVLMLVIGLLSSFAAIAGARMAIRFQREWREAVARRSVRAPRPHGMV
jgi:hypothetical protein